MLSIIVLALAILFESSTVKRTFNQARTPGTHPKPTCRSQLQHSTLSCPGERNSDKDKMLVNSNVVQGKQMYLKQ